MISLNFHDMYEYKSTLSKYKEHLVKSGKANENSLKRYFNYKDKLVVMSPFSYSVEKEKVSGFNDDQHFLLNGKHKVSVDEYFKLAMEHEPDLIINPCEQVTSISGKKKRKRSIKASIKHLEKFSKLIQSQEEDKQKPLIASVTLGDEDGLDTFEIRQFMSRVVNPNDEEEPIPYEGIMIYGTDLIKEKPAAFQELKDFLGMLPKDKLRMAQGNGSPGMNHESFNHILVEVLNGLMAGLDIFESDYPLELAEQGIALLIEDLDLETLRKKDKSQAQTYLQISKSLQDLRQKTLNLSKEENKEDDQPLIKGCQCYTCKNYKRAYFYHLLEVKEMNANILIGMYLIYHQHYSHNTFQYNRLFEHLRINMDILPLFIEDYISKNCEKNSKA